MKIIFFLFFCLTMSGQANIIEWQQKGLTYQDATLDNKLVVSGEIEALRCVNCSFEIVSNGKQIVNIGNTIESDKVLSFSKDGKPRYFNLLGQRVDKPTEEGWYFINRGNITNEVYIDGFGSFNAINRGL